MVFGIAGVMRRHAIVVCLAESKEEVEHGFHLLC